MLLEFAGAMAVYGDVDRKLRRSMEGMAAAVEGADCAVLLAEGEEQLAAVRAGEGAGGRAWDSGAGLRWARFSSLGHAPALLLAALRPARPRGSRGVATLA